MLRVRTIYAASAGASAKYYTRYLAEPGEEHGQWHGHQADGLGLGGRVETDQLEALLSGHDPITGTRLGAALADRCKPDGTIVSKAVAGYDATFSAPKSLSVWWGLTGDRGLLDAHDLAVAAVLEHLERHGATTRVRVNGARSFVDTQGLTMATFRQSTSREDDPQLHTHAIISTKVRSPDGRWLALDARYLKRKQRALGGLYQSVLRAQLTHRYGIAWGPIVDGQAEIAGMPKGLLDVFSKRTRQVDELLAIRLMGFRETEGRDPTLWERAAITRQAAADSRAAKSGTPVTNLATRWRQEAAALGWSPTRMTNELARAAAVTGPGERVTIERVLDRVTASTSTWLPIDLLQAVCDLTPPHAQFSGRDWAAALQRAVSQLAGEHHDLDPPEPGTVRASDGRSIWVEPTKANLTHERILAQEERVLTFAIDAHDTRPAPSATVEVAGLDVLQADAARAVAGADPLVLVVGPAGAGKTTALACAVADLERAGRPVFGVAPTAKAARVLGTETGMPADTIAKLLHEWSRPDGPRPPHRLPAGTTLIADEAGMVGTESLDRLISLAVSKRWRLVLVGDPRQLHAVGRGGMFDELCRTGRTHELATIHRFSNTWEQVASLQLRSARTTAIDTYVQHGRVAAGSIDHHLDAVADAWITHTGQGRRVAVTAETNAHVDALNTAIQTRCRQAGLLDDRHAVRVAGSETASAGDLVVTRRNDRTLLTDHGEPVRNRELWKADAAHDDGSLTVSRVEGHGTVTLPADYVRTSVRLGYAATAHGHQGDTTDISLTLVTAATTHRSLYVGATRARHENHLHVITDEPDLTEARDVLERVLTNDRADIPAVVRRQELATAMNEHRGPTAVNEAEARRALRRAETAAAPYDAVVRDAGAVLRTARATLRDLERRSAGSGPITRLRLRDPIHAATAAVDQARGEVDMAVKAARPTITAKELAQSQLDEAHRTASRERLVERLNRLGREPVRRDPAGLSLGR